jgi:hypothetical protein
MYALGPLSKGPPAAIVLPFYSLFFNLVEK